jgi:hypothetical protein
MNQESLEFYRSHSEFTNPGKYAYLFENLPSEPADLQKIISGIRVNFYSDQLVLGYRAAPDRLPEIELRTVENMLAQTLALSPGTLGIERPVNKRVVGTCRDAALMMCSLFRHRGIPARIRVGFSPSQLSFLNMIRDHSVCEYWDASEEKWIILEAELTQKHLEFHRSKTNVDLTNLQFPYFEHAGTAVTRWLNGNRDRYDYLDQGFWFFRNLFLRDVAFLNKVEVNIWDYWGVMLEEPGLSSEPTVAMLRELGAGDQQSAEFTEKVRDNYRKEKRLQVPNQVLCKCPAHSAEAWRTLRK